MNYLQVFILNVANNEYNENLEYNDLKRKIYKDN